MIVQQQDSTANKLHLGESQQLAGVRKRQCVSLSKGLSSAIYYTLPCSMADHVDGTELRATTL
jgi:hypothetical protein